MKMSPNFSLSEMTVTQTGIENRPSLAQLACLRTTALGMEQIRAILGHRPIAITSAFRSKQVNYRVGGVPNSDHTLGYACDFTISGLNTEQAFDMLRESFLQFDQLILERRNTIIHVSFNPRLRNQVMTQTGGPGTAIRHLERRA